MVANILTLPSSKDRHSLIIDELVSQGIAARFWYGEIAKYRVANGIARSHKKIIRHAKYAKEREVLVMEDDVAMTHPKSLSFFLDNKPTEFDIYLGTISGGFIQPDNSINKFSGLLLYIVHERFYDRFLSLPEDKDIDLALEGKGRFIVCNPMVAVSHDIYSTHHKKVMNYTEKGTFTCRPLYNGE